MTPHISGEEAMMNITVRTRRRFGFKSLVIGVLALAIPAALSVYLLFFTPDNRLLKERGM